MVMKKEDNILKARVIHNGHYKTIAALIKEYQTDVSLFYGKSIEAIKQNTEYTMFHCTDEVFNLKSIAVCCVQLNDAPATENHYVVIDAFREVGNLFDKPSGTTVLKFDKPKTSNRHLHKEL